MKWLKNLKRKYQIYKQEKDEEIKQTFIQAVIGSYCRVNQKNSLQTSFKPYLNNLKIENTHDFFIVLNNLSLDQLKMLWGKNFKKIINQDYEIRHPEPLDRSLLSSYQQEYKFWRLDHLVLEPVKEYPVESLILWAESYAFKSFLETGKIYKKQV